MRCFRQALRDGRLVTAAARGVTNKAEQGRPQHVPVMLSEVLELIRTCSEGPDKVLLDMTFGAGGHTQALLAHASRIYALDRDPVAYSMCCDLAAAETTRGKVVPMQGRFSEVGTLLRSHGVAPGRFDAVLFDLGASSMQFDNGERGFSVSRDGPLDMRMDGNRVAGEPTAADVVNGLGENDLVKILKSYGEEGRARQIARSVAESRLLAGPIRTTGQLLDVVQRAFGSDESRSDKLDRPASVATKTFQALRIFVNDELNELYAGLQLAHAYLRPGGCCVVISFHSLEDRIVKQCFNGGSVRDADNVVSKSMRFECRWQPLLQNKVLLPSDVEVESNPRARSAKLRAAVKID